MTNKDEIDTEDGTLEEKIGSSVFHIIFGSLFQYIIILPFLAISYGLILVIEYFVGELPTYVFAIIIGIATSIPLFIYLKYFTKN